MTASILVDVQSTASGSAPSGSWGTVPGCSATGVTVAGTNSVLLIFGSVTIAEAADDTAEFRFSVNGSPTGSPIGKSFADRITAGEVSGMSLIWAVDGLSGSSNSFTFEWKDIVSGSSIDTAKTHVFQVIEIPDGDAEILAETSSTGSATAPASESNLFQLTGVSVASTSSILLLMGNVPIGGTADAVAAFRFGVDNSALGGRTKAFSDNTNNHDRFSWGGCHVETGVSAGTHTFELKWQDWQGVPAIVDTARLRTFQVVEITANADLLTDLETSNSWTVGSPVNDPVLDSDETIDGTNSVVLTIANASSMDETGDRSILWTLGIDDADVGAEMSDFVDNTDTSGYGFLLHAETGLTGSHSFQLRGTVQQGTPHANTNLARTLFVIDLKESGTTFVDLSGTASMSLTPSGNATLLANIAGTSTATLTPSGNATLLASMSGTSTVTLTPSGNLVGNSRLGGTATLSLTPSGDLTLAVGLGGTSTITLTPSGNLVGNQRLGGTGTITLTPSGDLTLLTALAGTGTITLTPNGDLIIGAFAELAGTAAILLTPSGNLALATQLSGTSTLTLTPSGALSLAVGLSGTGNILLTPSGNLLGDLRLGGTSTLTLTPSGNLALAVALSSTATVTLTPSGGLALLSALAGTGTITLTPSGNLIIESGEVVTVGTWSGVVGFEAGDCFLVQADGTSLNGPKIRVNIAFTPQ